MECFPTYVPVVAAAIGPDDAGRWLMHRRPPGKHHSGLWEFPGGKIDAGEGARAALAREIAEECGVTVRPNAMHAVTFAADEPSIANPRPVLLLLFSCPEWEGEPRSLEGGEWAWFTPQEIMELAKPPLDCRLAPALFAPRDS